MSFRITKREDAVPYEAKGHYGMLATRLHNPADVNDGSMTQGLSHFLPARRRLRPQGSNCPDPHCDKHCARNRRHAGDGQLQDPQRYPQGPNF